MIKTVQVYFNIVTYAAGYSSNQFEGETEKGIPTVRYQLNTEQLNTLDESISSIYFVTLYSIPHLNPDSNCCNYETDT